MALRIEIRTDELDRDVGDIRARLADPTPVFNRFAQYMRVKTDSTFDQLRRGGTYRGVTWDGFAPQYTRKDGTVIPAHGGIAKVRGGGVVQGRMRPSGQRLNAGDSIMQDTGTMRSRAALVMNQTRRTLTLGPQGVQYAAAQHAKRPFLFFTDADADMLAKFAVEHIGR